MKHALEQIRQLKIDPEKPMIISDADEVILHFSDLLKNYLSTQDMYFNFGGYALNDSIRYQKDDQPVSRRKRSWLFNDFFDKYTAKQILVEGVRESLFHLSKKCQIIILTNIPHDYADARRTKLSTLGLDYPMVSSSGPKGALVEAISQHCDHKSIFIDDLSSHHTSVAEFSPDTLRIQYIAHEQLNSVEKKATDCHYRCRDWNHIRQTIEAFI